MAGLIGSSSKNLRVQEFRSSGIFTVPSGVRTVSLFMVGGGGGGASGIGGQGGNVVEINYDVSGKASCAVVIGAGGLSGFDGGDTTFDGIVVANGGICSMLTKTSMTYTPAGLPGGKNGFGGHAMPPDIGAMNNGARPYKSAAANTGAGAFAATYNGGSGYVRVEWYE